MAGDRTLRLRDADGSGLTARTRHQLLSLAATLGADGEPLVEGLRWSSPEALERLREVAPGAAFSERGRHFDDAPVLLVTDGALALMGEDRRRFRANLVVAGVEGLAERDWLGRRLRVGQATLLVRESCRRCIVTTIDPDTFDVRPDVLRRINEDFDRKLGVYCEVAAPGTIAVGDDVALTD